MSFEPLEGLSNKGLLLLRGSNPTMSAGGTHANMRLLLTRVAERLRTVASVVG